MTSNLAMASARVQKTPPGVLAGGGRHFLELPDELLVQIVSYLPPRSAIPLHSTCRRLRGLTRQDPALWRSLCAYQEALDTHPAFVIPTPPLSASNAAAMGSNPIPTIAAAWPIPGIRDAEKIDWYNEYKFRHAPLKMRWFCAAEDKPDVGVGLGDEVKGTVVFPSAGATSGNDMLLSSLSDGSVCIWSLKNTASRRGRKVVARSRPGLVFSDQGDEKWQGRRKAREAEIVDGISVDGVTGRVWVAGEEGLIEIDLNTLQKVSTHRFPFSITTLSQTSHPHPLTVGTTLTLHLHDPRVAVPASTVTFSPGGTDDERVQPIHIIPQPLIPSHPFRKNYLLHATLFQPGPLSIIHSDPLTGGSSGDGEIYVAGRFPSILCYSRRMWPKLRGTIHSGGRLCALANIPYSRTSPYPTALDSDIEEVTGIGSGGGRAQTTLLAAGEYNGRGTLEVYPLRSVPTSFPGTTVPAATSAIKNRQTASRSKLLTVASHGARIVTGDADGVVKWVERDGRKLVRTYVVEPPGRKRRDSVGLWGPGGAAETTNRGNVRADGGEVVRKLIVAKQGGEELVVWAGDQVGVLGTFGAEESDVEVIEEFKDIEEVYLGRMREVLERQAEEVRIMAGLGVL